MNDILNIISSSSKGNCYIYNKDLMLDIGVSFAKIKFYIKDLKLLLLTHRHQDHINKKTLQKLIYEKPTLKIVCGEWLVQLLIDLGVCKKNIYVLKLNKKYDLGKYIIEPIEAIHDVPNCGYKITIKATNYKIFHITDTSEVSHIEAKNFNIYCIESNYKEDILEYHKDNCENENEMFYLDRIDKTHLSYEEANDFLINNMGANSEYEYIHKSNYNFKEDKNEYI